MFSEWKCRENRNYNVNRNQWLLNHISDYRGIYSEIWFKYGKIWDHNHWKGSVIIDINQHAFFDFSDKMIAGALDFFSCRVYNRDPLYYRAIADSYWHGSSKTLDPHGMRVQDFGWPLLTYYYFWLSSSIPWFATAIGRRRRREGGGRDTPPWLWDHGTKWNPLIQEEIVPLSR